MSSSSRGKIVPIRTTEPTAPAGDDELVRRACAKDAGAQAELFRRHAPRITGLMVRLLGSHADAEDAVQETFVIALAELGRLREASSVGPWLTQLAVHQAHRRFRRRRLLRALGLDRAPSDAALDLIADPAAPPDVLAELALLDEVLAELPAGERIAWMLRHVEGYELREVARLVGSSLATAKRRIAAAHARITRRVAVEAYDA
jgi:RNA polymerase sigma-70 factor (ECF subfamily)